MKYFIFIFSFLLFLSFTFASQTLIDSNIGNHQVKVIKVDLADGDYKIVTSIANTGESLDFLMKKVGGVSAINGAYFCPADYKHCGGKSWTNAPRFFMGLNFSKYGTDFGYNGVFAFDKNDNPFLVMNPIWGDIPDGINSFNENKIKDIYYAIGNFPVLLLSGRNILPYYDEVLSQKIKNKTTKAFICSTNHGKVIYMGYVSNISIYELPSYLKKYFSCENAINLDAGGSLGLIYNKKYIRKNGRPIMDAFVVVPRSVEKERREIISKYQSLLDRIYNKIVGKFGANKLAYQQVIVKIRKIERKYSNNFEILALLDYLELKLSKNLN